MAGYGRVHGGGGNGTRPELPAAARAGVAGITFEYGAVAEGGTRDNDTVGMARLTAVAWRTLAAEAAGGL